MEFFFLLAGLAIAALTGYVAYREDKFRGNPLPETTGGIVQWLESSHHWHDYGHFLLDFVMTITTMVASVLVLLGAMQSPGLVRWLGVPLLRFIINHPIGMSFLCMIPSTLLTLWIEIKQDGHWRSFLGIKDDTRDFIFDVFTHLAGGATAAMMLSSLALSIYKLVPITIILKMFGVL